MSVDLQVLHVPDCPNLAPMLERLHAATDLPITTREISTDTEAAAAGMAGSPTLLINGVDPFAAPESCDCALSCRLYRDEDGRIVPAPSIEQLRSALTAATTSVDVPVAGTEAAPSAVLSAWRTRAVPLEPVEKAVHQAILRSWATTGQPPTSGDLDSVTAHTGRVTSQVLAALHDLDAIRLSPAGKIAVAYPFSAAPTRHRVRIADRVDVYAMCAIDALGIAAMLDEPTRIESIDVTTHQAITVTMTADDITWNPAGTVVFIGAEAGGGPSADCCCDYLNFFATTDAAQTWTAAHPHIPGTILDQTEAVDLSTRLFEPLLRTDASDVGYGPKVAAGIGN